RVVVEQLLHARRKRFATGELSELAARVVVLRFHPGLDLGRVLVFEPAIRIGDLLAVQGLDGVVLAGGGPGMGRSYCRHRGFHVRRGMGRWHRRGRGGDRRRVTARNEGSRRRSAKEDPHAGGSSTLSARFTRATSRGCSNRRSARFASPPHYTST